MKRPRILLDVDGPLTSGFVELTCEYLRDEGVEADPRKVTTWDIFKSFGVSQGVEAAVRKRLQMVAVACQFEPLPGAEGFLRQIREWADVYAVTAPLDGSPTWTHDRERWLRWLGFDRTQIIHARDKRLIRGDAFIDDKPDHVVEWGGEYPNGLAILWSAPYNTGSEWWGPRASGYEELAWYLESLEVKTP